MRSGIPVYHCDDCGGRIVNLADMHWLHKIGASRVFCGSCWRRVR